MLKLRLPTMEDKEKIMEYKEEFLRNGDSLDGTGGLKNADTYEVWFEKLKEMGREETVPEGLVLSTTFLAVDETDRLIGMINIRHRLNEALLRRGGHIGYSVRKSERRKGHATEMLGLALEEAERLGLCRVLVTCGRENTGSARTIQKNGGVLENEIIEGSAMVQRYWIELK